MELRDIEIFLALAEELHFSRTAARLHVTQARVSQSVRHLEHRIGARLFDRTSRSVRLTAVGEQLHREWKAGYRRILRGVDVATAAARGHAGVLTIGTTGPHFCVLKGAMRLLRTRHPAVRIRHREIQQPAPLELLESGEVDVALLWLPVDAPGLAVGPVVHTSSLRLMVGASHPLAGKEAVRLEDFADCTFVSGHGLPPAMADALTPFRTPSGRPVPRGPRVSTWHEVLNTVACGQAVATAAAEATGFYTWPNLVFLPVADAPPVRWALCWQADRDSPLVQAFVRAASDAAPE
ncbi:LysR substrate-binding domain-containing protein [Streptomyces sp. URMC 126]|uniref:LysR substrate-binding domain-containing protein n=1 Tax=Streptomyces sp. URMC 126 TaxID=3423401 RepID=UPI003F19C367